MLEEEQSVSKKGIGTGFLTFAVARDVSIIAFVLVVAIRFSTADFNIELKDFSFTDLLSLFLAVSSVALSAAFYFKADESARSFYTHTYKFTKDVSEMLGRIDSGFGEKLRNIDQGYIGLSEKFDRFTVDPALSSSVVAAAKAKQFEIQEQEAERYDIILDLVNRAKIIGDEKQELLQKYGQLTKELEQSRLELAAQEQTSISARFGIAPGFVDFMIPIVARHYNGMPYMTPDQVVLDAFTGLMLDPAFTEATRSYMESKGLMAGVHLTDKGVSFVRAIIGKQLGI
ncbi:hypothetical protein [Pseudomonas sp. 50_B]|uniref:hypothetical protein n=1 Tax=Pseudomonas sp. 50_B TaxID=2813574 RepID=UPI001A9CE628|nr:hypothetical protein [Pseudomonas sp. 50_B]